MTGQHGLQLGIATIKQLRMRGCDRPGRAWTTENSGCDWVPDAVCEGEGADTTTLLPLEKRRRAFGGGVEVTASTGPKNMVSGGICAESR